MLTLSTGLALWLLAGAAVTGALVRLVLALLAAHAARRALSRRGASSSLRAHQLAVLRTLVEGLTAVNGGRGRGR